MVFKNIMSPEPMKYKNMTKTEVMIIIDYTVMFIDLNNFF